MNLQGKKILIVDDNEMNRVILQDMLGDEFELLEADGGRAAIDILREQHDEIGMVLLDVVMPDLDGFGVLGIMKENGWLDDIQVIMISAESDPAFMKKAYLLGAVDFINRPFDSYIVHRKITNTIMLYAKQRQLTQMVAREIAEREKNTNLMIAILSHIVEFRNGESGLHVLHINIITEMLLERLLQKTDKYDEVKGDIPVIRMASSLHDIGKIAIPNEILNKPGRLTPMEYEIMKTHSAVGAETMGQLYMYKDEPLIKYSYQICRWHHERYDGRGYPDKLSGDDIPIAAQIVSIADVYDALTSKRCYKEAYSHEKSMEMILNNECGVFNPLLIECLKEIAPELQTAMNYEYSEDDEKLRRHALQSVLHELKDFEVRT